MIGDLESKVLSVLIFSPEPMTTKEIAETAKLSKEEVHKALVMLRREKRVQFIGKNLGWIPT
jgi:DNA-binding transcriptional regulator GbsR (MarR family)